MQDADLSPHIEQMVKFIQQEAKEKADEVNASAEEDYNIQKLQLVEAEKRKICQEHEKKAKQVEIRRKIEYSMQLNASRIKVLQAQDDLVNNMRAAACKELLHVVFNEDNYRILLRDLIVQSLLRLKEPSAILRCRGMDRTLVGSILEEAKGIYAEKAGVNVPKIKIDDREDLPPPLSSYNAHGPSCSGGIVLASQDGKIVCENTLDARLEVVFRQKLPEVQSRTQFLYSEMGYGRMYKSCLLPSI